MRIKITTKAPRSLIEGWTGFVTLPSGRKIALVDYCGGAPVAFNSKAALMKEAVRVAKANYERPSDAA